MFNGQQAPHRHDREATSSEFLSVRRSAHIYQLVALDPSPPPCSSQYFVMLALAFDGISLWQPFTLHCRLLGIPPHSAMKPEPCVIRAKSRCSRLQTSALLLSPGGELGVRLAGCGVQVSVETLLTVCSHGQ